MGLLGDATSSKTSLVGVACRRGAMHAHGVGVLGTEVAGNGYLRFEPVRCTVSHQRQPSNGRAEGVGFNKSSSSDD